MASEITEWKGDRLFGFRGVYRKGDEEFAAMQICVDSPVGEILIIDIPSRCLPYLPDMSEGSEFQRKGYWHHYPCEGGYSVFLEETDYHKYHLKKVVLNGKTLFGTDSDVSPAA